MNEKLPRIRIWAIVTMAALVYLPSLSGGFINYDDGWLIRDNRFYESASPASLLVIWADFSKETRLLLGAEYLPVRDTSVLIDVLLFGLSPQAMRAINLILYLGSAVFCICAMRRVLGTSWRSDFVSAFFVLHPAHAESVAWIVGRKDVLGLLFFWIAVWLHTSKLRYRTWGTTALLMLAQLSKFLFIAAPALLLGLDLLRSRDHRPLSKFSRYLAPSLGVFSIAVIQLLVAKETAMVDVDGPGYLERLYTMGPVWLGYVKSALLGVGMNVMHDVVVRTRIDTEVFLGYGCVLLLLLCMFHHRRLRTESERIWFVAGVCFFAPLLFVSQIFAPIQNFHADRYLLLSVLGSGLAWLPILGLVEAFVKSHRQPFARLIPMSIPCALAAMSGYRAWLFSDPIRLFKSASENSSYSGAPLFQLGHAYESRGETDRALLAYHKTLTRPDSPSESGRRATNQMAKLYAASGNLPQAERVLRRGALNWPRDPKIVGNLAEIVFRLGYREESRRLFEQVISRFPSYETARLNYERHFGSRKPEASTRSDD